MWSPLGHHLHIFHLNTNNAWNLDTDEGYKIDGTDDEEDEESFDVDEVKSISDVLSVLAELNESGVELTMQEVYDDALDYLL